MLTDSLPLPSKSENTLMRRWNNEYEILFNLHNVICESRYLYVSAYECQLTTFKVKTFFHCQKKLTDTVTESNIAARHPYIYMPEYQT